MPLFMSLIPSSDAISLSHPKRYCYRKTFYRIPSFIVILRFIVNLKFSAKAHVLSLIYVLSQNIDFSQFITFTMLCCIIAIRYRLHIMVHAPLFPADAILRSRDSRPINPPHQPSILYRSPHFAIAHCYCLKASAPLHTPDAILRVNRSRWICPR